MADVTQLFGLYESFYVFNFSNGIGTGMLNDLEHLKGQI
jgi:hypothetical protein